MAGPTPKSAQILRTYVTLTLLSTFASSFIWGINTLFLLDAGLTITEAFAANAFFTAGQVLFEVPTGVVADTVGRRTSYLLGAATLFLSTLLYLLLWRTHGPFAAWALVSMLLGLGFSFFSGATEAWLVDGLNATGYEDSLDSAFAKGQIAGGVAMLTGTVAGGVIAQATSLGVPYALRALMLATTFAVAFFQMRDVGFTPRRGVSVLASMGAVVRSSFEYGFRNPPVRWLMLGAPFSGGVGMYAFYAMQPYLLELAGRKDSYSTAGLAAAIVAGMQIVGGYLVRYVGRGCRRRTSFLVLGVVVSTAALAAIGLVSSFGAALALFAIWALVFCCRHPGPAGVHQRRHSVRAASHCPLLGQPPRLVRRCRRPAGAGPGRRGLGLSGVVRRQRRDPARRAALRPARPARTGAFGLDRRGNSGRPLPGLEPSRKGPRAPLSAKCDNLIL